MGNPISSKNKKLLMDFIDYIEQEGNQSGYLLVNKGNYKGNTKEIQRKYIGNMLRP